MDISDAVAAGQHPILEDDMHMHAFTSAHLQGEMRGEGGGAEAMQAQTSEADAQTQPQQPPPPPTHPHPLESTRLPEEVRVETMVSGERGGEQEQGEGAGEGATQLTTTDAEMMETQAEPGEESQIQTQLPLTTSQPTQPSPPHLDTGEQSQMDQGQASMATSEAGPPQEQPPQREGHPGMATPRESTGETLAVTRTEEAQSGEGGADELKKEEQQTAAGVSEPGDEGGRRGEPKLPTAVVLPVMVPYIDTRSTAILYSQLCAKSQMQPLNPVEMQLLSNCQEALMQAQLKRFQQPPPEQEPDMIRAPCYFCSSPLQFPANAPEVQCPSCHGLLLPRNVYQTVCPRCTQLLKYELNAWRIKCPACDLEFEVLPPITLPPDAQQQQQLPQQLQQPQSQPQLHAEHQFLPPPPLSIPSSMPSTPAGAGSMSGATNGNVASVASGSGGKTPKVKRERVKRVKESASPLQPKRGLTAKMLFTKAHREEFKVKYPGRTTGEVTKLLGEAFTSLPEEKKATWNETAAIEKARYEREKAVYDSHQQQQQQQMQLGTPEQAPAPATQPLTPFTLPQPAVAQQHQPPQQQLPPQQQQLPPVPFHPLGMEVTMLLQQRQVEQLYRHAAPYIQRAGEFAQTHQQQAPLQSLQPPLHPVQSQMAAGGTKPEEFPAPPPQLPPMPPTHHAPQSWPTTPPNDPPPPPPPPQQQQHEQAAPSEALSSSTGGEADVKQLPEQPQQPKEDPAPVGNLKMEDSEEKQMGQRVES